MKDEKRIARICSLIDKAWRKNPEWNLMTIISNCFDDALDLPFVEDKDLEIQLKSIYGEEKDNEVKS